MGARTFASAAVTLRHRDRVLVAVVCAVIGAAATTALTAPRGAGGSSSAVPLRAVTITLTLEAHARRGEMGANRASRGKWVKVGEEFEGTLGSGTLKSRDACDVQATQEPTYLTWRVRTKVLSADTDHIALDVAWTRTSADGGGAEGSATVTIAPGRSHLVDIVPNQAEDWFCSHVALRLTAERANAVSGELLVHRLWLAHEQGGVRTVSEPVEAIGKAGDTVAFRFRPLRWDLNGAPIARPQGLEIDVDIAGTVVSELQEDGGVETTVDVKRETLFGIYSSRGSGTMVMAGRMGDAGEVQLPTSGGLGVLPGGGIPAGPLARGLVRQDGKLRIDFSEFFAGSRTSLVIAVERLR